MTEMMLLDWVYVEIHNKLKGSNSVGSEWKQGFMSKLLVKPKSNFSIDECVFIADSKDKTIRKTNGYFENDETLKLKIHLDKIEWACIEASYFAGLRSKRKNSVTHKEIDGCPGGPLPQVKGFLEKYRKWITKNNPGSVLFLLNATKSIAFISATKAIESAMDASTTKRKNAAWQEVVRILDLDVTWKPSDFGVLSAPVKIALAVQKNYKEAWKLKGPKAYAYDGDRPYHPGSSKKYYTLPYEHIKLKLEHTGCDLG